MLQKCCQLQGTAKLERSNLVVVMLAVAMQSHQDTSIDAVVITRNEAKHKL
jgi:hypothetical protein